MRQAVVIGGHGARGVTPVTGQIGEKRLDDFHGILLRCGFKSEYRHFLRKCQTFVLFFAAVVRAPCCEEGLYEESRSASGGSAAAMW